MSDIQEIRRFWPWAMTICEGEYFRRRNHAVWSVVDEGGAWLVSVRLRTGAILWRGMHGRGPTIAAAMAAAGFAERKPDKYARQRNQLSRWVAECQRGEGDFFSVTPPQSRQRPHKKVRLGKRGRRLALAASIAEALNLVRQKRLDRREMGNV